MSSLALGWAGQKQEGAGGQPMRPLEERTPPSPCCPHPVLLPLEQPLDFFPRAGSLPAGRDTQMAFMEQEQNISSWPGSSIPAGQRPSVTVTPPQGRAMRPAHPMAPGLQSAWVPARRRACPPAPSLAGDTVAPRTQGRGTLCPRGSVAPIALGTAGAACG